MLTGLSVVVGICERRKRMKYTKTAQFGWLDEVTNKNFIYKNSLPIFFPNPGGLG